jgi:hypothetical protein
VILIEARYAPLPLSIAERIAGWGETVEVVESDAVRTALARIGAELRPISVTSTRQVDTATYR